MGKHLLLLVTIFMAGCASLHDQPEADSAVDIDQANLPPEVQAPIPITPHTAFREDYPAESVQAHEVGATRLHYMILENGTVGDIQILESSGFQRLDDASIAMVRNRWTFMPATRNGQPIRAWQRAKLVWQLNDVPPQT